MKSIDFSDGGKVSTLIETSQGLLRDSEVHFEGGKIVFSMRKNIEDDYHIYEINTDGTGFKQLTSAPGVADFDPLYLPDDSIVFLADVHLSSNNIRKNETFAKFLQNIDSILIGINPYI